MAREDLNINTFEKGIIGVVDEDDIPDNAASWSINVDRETIPGKLVGRFDDVLMPDGNGDPIQSAYCNRFIDNNGNYDLVYYDKTNGDISYVTDFFNATPGSVGTVTDLDASLGTSKNVCMEVMNNTVHMGWGKTVNEPSKWIGRLDHGLFGGAVPSGIKYLNAEASSEMILPTFHKVITDWSAVVTYLYGIEWQGNRIYKIDIAADNGINLVSKKFVCLQAICEWSADRDEYFYVFDKESTYGAVYKIKKLDLSISAKYSIGGWVTSGAALTNADDVISDIATTANYMFFFNSRADQTYSQVNDTEFKILYKIQLSTLSATTSNIPTLAYSLKANANDAFTLDIAAKSSTISLTPLVDFIPGETGTIGIAAYLNDTNLADGGGTVAPLQTALILCQEAVATETKLKDTHVVTGIFAHASSQLNTISFSCVVATNSLFLIDAVNSLIYYTTPAELATINYATTTWTSPNLPDTLALTDHFSLTGTTSNLFTLCPGYGVVVGAVTTEYCYLLASAIGVDENHGRLARFTAVNTSGTLVVTDPIAIGATAYLYHSIVTMAASSVASPVGTFDGNEYAYYKLSFIYDNIEESTLTSTTWSLKPTISQSVKLDISIDDRLPLRITGINIYRAEHPTSSGGPSTFYRLVDTIDTSSNEASLTSDGWGTTYTWTIYDTQIYGVGYNENSGISETLPNNTLNYELSAQLMGYHFVTRAWNEEFVEDATRMLFRSKRNAFDIFDWSVDYLVLPFYPTALIAFAGSIFAFTENRYARINPEGLYIEEIIEGSGVYGQQAVRITPYGMFYGDKNNLYVHDGVKVTSIGDQIKFIVNTNGEGWYTRVNTATKPQSPYCIVAPMLKYNYILFTIPWTPTVATSGTLTVGRTYTITTYNADDSFTSVATVVSGTINTTGCVFVATGTTPSHWSHSSVLTESLNYIYAYHIPTKSWDVWTYRCDTYAVPAGYIPGKDNQAYLSFVAGTLKICGYTSRVGFTWYSKDFDLGDMKQKKAMYNVSCPVYTGTAPTITVQYDSTGSFASFAAKVYKNSVMVKIVGAATTVIEYLNIQYRTLIGKR